MDEIFTLSNQNSEGAGGMDQFEEVDSDDEQPSATYSILNISQRNGGNRDMDKD